MNQDQIINYGPSEEEIKLLKAKNKGQLTQIDIPKLKKSLVFKKPDRSILGASIQVSKTDALEGTRVMALNCLVWGDAELIEDVDVLLSISPKIDALIEDYELEVKNL